MGLWKWLRKQLNTFDEQVEQQRPERPASGARKIVTDAETGHARRRDVERASAPATRRTPPPAPPRAPRHRLDPERRPRGDDYGDPVAGVDADIALGAALESATPRWIDESGHHDHRHHGHGGAAEHRADDNTSSGHASHHGGGGHHHTSHDFGAGSHHTPHDFGGGGGGYDGGASCGGGGGDI